MPTAKAVSELPALKAIIDGELVLPGVNAKPGFGGLKAAVRTTPGKLVLVAFDLRHCSSKVLWIGR